MKKSDWILILFLVVVSCVLFVQLLFVSDHEQGVVKYDGEVILSFDLTKNASYEVVGYNGNVFFEVLNGKVSVLEETSNYHLCSNQGYVDIQIIPLVCLPNKIVIETQEQEVDGVTT